MLRSAADSPRSDLTQEILKPFYHLRNTQTNTLVFKGFPEAVNYWLKVPRDKVNEICDFAESLFKCVILTDDIQDNSLLRRHVPTAHCVFGTNLTITASTLAMCYALKDGLNLGHENVIPIALNSCIEMVTGQGIELYWREHMIRPSEEDYKFLGKNKSVSAFDLPFRLMQLFSDDKRDYSKLVQMIGNHYQIRDDYCNLVDHEALEGKSSGEEQPIYVNDHFCEDFTEGKRSLPIIHAMRTSPEIASTLESILKQETRNIEIKKYCLSILKSAGSLEYTLDVMRKLDGDIREEIKRLGGNPDLEAYLDSLYV